MARSIAWDVVVVGGANTDFLVQGARLPAPEHIVEGDEFQEAAGGKGANQAVAAARLGARVALVACVGADARGDMLLSRVAAEGVDTSLVQREPGTPTGAAVVMVDARGTKMAMFAPGANRLLRIDEQGPAAAAIAGARVVVTQLEVPLDAVRLAATIAKRAGAGVVLDPAPPEPLPDELLACVDLVRPNAREAETLTGARVFDRGSARWSAEMLVARGAGAAAIQAGAEGTVVVWRDGSLFLPIVAVRAVDRTGAGDAFVAAMAVQMAEGKSVGEAAPFANAAAALATTKLGAQAAMPTRAEVEDLASRFGPREAPRPL